MAERSRIATGADAAEVAALLHRFQREYDEPSPGAEVLEPRVRDHIERDLSVFLLAGPPDVGVAQLRFRDYLITGSPWSTSRSSTLCPTAAARGTGGCSGDGVRAGP